MPVKKLSDLPQKTAADNGDGFVITSVTGQDMRVPFQNLGIKELEDKASLLQGQVDDLEANQLASTIGFETKVLMDADLAHADGTVAQVMQDTTSANNGYYRKDGASGAGSWVKRTSLYAETLDPNDTSEAVSGKAVGDWTNPRLEQETPFKIDDDALSNDDFIKSVVRLKLVNADESKEYYIRDIGKNYDDSGTFYNFFGIAEVISGDLVCVAKRATIQGRWENTENVSGYEFLKLKEINDSGITGEILINWDGITDGVRYILGDGTSRILNELTKVSEDKKPVNPFKVNDRVNINNDFIDSLLSVSIEGADLNKDYYVKDFGKNYNQSGTFYNYLSIAEVVTGDLVCVSERATLQGRWENIESVSGVEFLELKEINESGIKGYILINWDGITDGVRYLSGDGTSRVLNKIVNQKVDAVNESEYRLLIPDELFFINENLTPIYKRSILSNESELAENAKVYIGKRDGDFPYYTPVETSVRVNPTDYNSELRIALRLFDGTYETEKYAYRKDLTVNKVSSSYISGKEATAIIAGDSITDFDISEYVGNKMSAYGGLLSHQGLRDSGGYNDEGRASWEYKNMYGKNSTLAGGSAIVPYLSGTDNSLNLNPFIRVATAGEIADNPEWCFEDSSGSGGVENELNYTESQAIGTYTGDYYTLSIIDYIANHSITVGDKLIFISNFGFNDINRNDGSDQSITDALMGIEILADRMNKYAVANPTKEVILGISPILIVQLFNHWDAFSSYIEQAILLINSLKTSYSGTSNFAIDVVPVWLSVSREWGWNYETANASTVPLSSDNDTIKNLANDMLHPGDFGKEEISNALVNYIANKL